MITVHKFYNFLCLRSPCCELLLICHSSTSTRVKNWQDIVENWPQQPSRKLRIRFESTILLFVSRTLAGMALKTLYLHLRFRNVDPIFQEKLFRLARKGRKIFREAPTKLMMQSYDFLSNGNLRSYFLIAVPDLHFPSEVGS